MKQYKVDIQFITNVFTKEEELCSLFNGIEYYIDDKLINNKIYWTLDFELNQDDDFKIQTEYILAHIDKKQLQVFNKKGNKIIIDIQVYYDTFTCSINLPSSFLYQIVSFFQDIEVNYSIYPTKF